jgi:hypothetical protein
MALTSKISHYLVDPFGYIWALHRTEAESAQPGFRKTSSYQDSRQGAIRRAGRRLARQS